MSGHEAADTAAPAPGEPDAPGPLTGHLLGYAELATALLRAWERTLVHRLAGAALLGLWLLRRRAVPAPASVLLEQLRKDALLVSEAWRGRWS